MIDFNTVALKRYRMWRYAKDRMASLGIAMGGIGVLVAILTIFLYLLYEVMPLFSAAAVEPQGPSYEITASQQDRPPYVLAMEEQGEIAFRLGTDGQALFFKVSGGDVLFEQQLGADITTVAVESAASQLFALAKQDGTAVIAKHAYRISYPNDQRLITPSIRFPYGTEPFVLNERGVAPNILAYRDGEERSIFAGQLPSGEAKIWLFDKQENFMTEEIELIRSEYDLPDLAIGRYKQLLISEDQNWVFVLSHDDRLLVLDIRAIDDAEFDIVVSEDLSQRGVARVEWLLGGISLLIAHDDGQLEQKFMARDPNGDFYLASVRNFSASEQAGFILPEERRKGFLTLSNQGGLGIFHSTAHRNLFEQSIMDANIRAAALSPRAYTLLVETAGARYQAFAIENKHPELSLSALWDKVWYESYEQPEYIWQSSASNNDFEPKYSLTPLSFGTLKAAFYAMLLAAPLAICGAIYTSYFMSAGWRRRVKPLIELMEALPTVILGFLAGLWLAPFMEMHLTSIFSLFLCVPIGVLLSAFVFSKLPNKIRNNVPEGWEAIILVPIIILIAWAALASGKPLELLFFGGDMRAWITHDLGVSFDQRNAMVVGIAMGFAVIPTIFSIAEDAVFSVPKHLSFGSLALGATRWQTLVGVVLPTASPGIFSGLMIGFGRAVGETMIVLMATGNTPIMDINIFEGMRTLAANIAVEIPEAEVDSSHYRVLFLTALVLFSFTFVVNTIAETVRQNLRKKYGQI